MVSWMPKMCKTDRFQPFTAFLVIPPRFQSAPAPIGRDRRWPKCAGTDRHITCRDRHRPDKIARDEFF